MGGKQSIPQDVQKYTPQSTQRYKRFCSVCRGTTYEFYCCGKKTRRVNLQATIGDRTTGMVRNNV